jgi:3-hydroxybutyryl-CoA dehydratase
MGKTANPLEGLNGFYFEDLKVGTTEEFSKTISESAIQTFAEVSGDENPLHLNPEYAKETVFKGCIAHGILTASFISTVPGCIYVAQNLKFKAPVRAGDMVKAVCTVTELNKNRKLVEIKTQCFVGHRLVVDGNATIMVPSRGDILS